MRHRSSDDERELVCTRCHALILVCGHVRDLNAATYVGVACGCRRPKTNAQIKADNQVAEARRSRDSIPF